MVEIETLRPVFEEGDEALAHLTALNTEADRIRTALGIDPALCLRFSPIHGADYANLPDYFAALERREFLTPLYGRNRWHDLKQHETQIMEAHPSLVEVVVQMATHGSDMLRSNNRQTAERITEVLESLFASPMITSRQAIITQAMRILPNPPDDIPSHVTKLLETQREYGIAFAKERETSLLKNMPLTDVEP